MDKLRAMASFVRIAERGGLTAAAADLGASLPSIVRRLSSLERELGTTLIKRTTRRLHLTEEGRQYLDHCRVILGKVRAAEASFESLSSEPRGRLAITASVMFGKSYIAGIIGDFVTRYGDVSAELLFVDRMVNLVEEGIDVAIRIGRLADSSLVAIPVGRVRRVVCASPGYLRRHGTPHHPNELRNRRCVRFTGLAPRSEWQFRIGARRRSVPVASVLTYNQAESAIEACVAGLGPGAFLSYMVARARRSGKLSYVLEDYEVEPLPVQVVYPHSRTMTPTVRTFIDVCVERLRQMKLD
jgi:DNA-binding transcriptional LysR family regulator